MAQPTVSKMERVQTAVDWYANELLGLMLELATNTITEIQYHIKRLKAFERAKQMEKEQIMKAYNAYYSQEAFIDG